jgi:hypothetical protein
VTKGLTRTASLSTTPPGLPPRLKPPVDSISNSTWATPDQYFPYVTDGRRVIFSDDARFSDNSSGRFYTICINTTTAELYYDGSPSEPPVPAHLVNGSLVPGIQPPASVGAAPTQFKYSDPACNEWFWLTENVPDNSSLGWYPVWHHTHLSDPKNYQCVSQDHYQWVCIYS